MSQYFDNKDTFLEPKVTQYGRNMVMSNVQRVTKHKFVNIDTKFRDEYSYNTTANYTVSMPERITNVHSIMVCNAEIPITYYNICANFGNNYFTLLDASGASTVITIPDNNYTAASLVSVITDQVNALSTNLNKVKFLLSGNNITYDVSGTATSLITVQFDYDAKGNFDKYNFKSKIGWLMGFRNQSYTIASKTVSTPIRSERFIDLNGPRYLYLTVDEFSQKNPNSFIAPQADFNMSKNILARITLNNTVYPFGSILPANNFNGYILADKRNYDGTIDIKKLQVQLVNDIGIPVDLNGYDFSFCLEIEYE